MNNSLLKSIVSSIQTATTNYFSPKKQLNRTFPPAESAPNHAAMAPDITGRKGIFKDVVFYDPSNELDQVHFQSLTAGGAVEYTSDGDFDWQQITHVLTDDVDFPGKQEAMRNERLVFVTPRWIEVSLRRGVLQNPKNFSPDPRMFFSGLVVTCAELPDGDREAIFGGFAASGGMYDDVLRTTTTHIIALNTENVIPRTPCLPQEKCRKAMKEEKLGIKIVLPHWFDDCLKLRRRVDEKPYLLPDPPLFKAFAAQNIGTNLAEPVPSDQLAYTHFGSIQSQSTPPACSVTIFKGNHKTVLLGSDLGISSRLRATLEHVIQQAGGVLVHSVAEAQVYIGAWREKDDYIQASLNNAVVGNLTWLYYMLANDRWISPRCHLLHYPLARAGIPEMKNMIITVTNYQGEARAYLEKLIEACGATFTRNMTSANTHLIAASKYGDKCKHAHEWGIDVVNHLWLEETYAKWALQPITIPQYIYFPPQTNLAEIVDKTQIQEEGIVDFFLPREEDDEDVADANLNAATAIRGNVQSSYVHTDNQASAPPNAVRSDPKRGPRPPTPQATSMQTPGSTKRKAAENAITKLHNEIMPDVLLWQKEKNRKRIPTDSPLYSEDMEMKKKAEKRKIEEKENLVEGVAKKQKTVESSKDDVEITGKIVLLVTGSTEDFAAGQGLKKLSRLGVKLVTEGGYCTHLAAPHILRTEKFLCALAYAPTVVSLQWVQDCLDQDRLLDPQAYLLRDPDNEKKYRITLQQSIAKARRNRRQLFKNFQIYVSANVAGGSSLLRIIESNGGDGRIVSHNIKPRAKIFRSDSVKSFDQILVCTEDAEDKALRTKFREEAADGGLLCRVYSSEWIMRSVLRQQIEGDKGIAILS